MKTKQVFKNKDERCGILYLACSDIELTYNQITTTYQKRLHYEVFHKSIKSLTKIAGITN